MVKVSTLFHRVDGFDENTSTSVDPGFLDLELEEQWIKQILDPLETDPEERIIQNILKHA